MQSRFDLNLTENLLNIFKGSSKVFQSLGPKNRILSCLLYLVRTDGMQGKSSLRGKSNV